MSNMIALEISGRNGEAWDRVFHTLTTIIERAVDGLMPTAEPETKEKAREITTDLAEIAKNWLQAKLEKPVLDNERTVAEIAARFEEIKLSQAKRGEIEVDTDIKRVRLERDRLALLEERLKMAFKWLGFLQQHFVRRDDGSVVLVLTNQDMSELLGDVGAMRAGLLGDERESA